VPTEIWRGREEEGWHESSREYSSDRSVFLKVLERRALGTSLGSQFNDGFLNRLSAYASILAVRLLPIVADLLEGYHEQLEAFPSCLHHCVCERPWPSCRGISWKEGTGPAIQRSVCDRCRKAVADSEEVD